MAQTRHSVEKKVTQHLALNYLLYLPSGHNSDPNEKWPFILFLHGAGERGSNLNLIKKHGIPKIVEKQDIPFVAISPQCPEDHWWSDYLPLLDEIIQTAIDTLNVDPDRVYLTGLSMGGYGTWHMAVEHPERFAAIAPICGGGPWMYNVRGRLDEIQHIPTWVFHGAKDDIVPLRESQVMVQALKDCGGDVQLTVYPNLKHNSWGRTYSNPKLFEWFLAHRRPEQ